MRTHLRKTKISDRGNILIFDKGVGLDLRNEPQRRAPRQLIEAERMSAIGRMVRLISLRLCATCSRRSMRTPSSSSAAIYVRARGLNLLLEISPVALAMTERIDSLLQFGSSGRKSLLVHEHVSSVVESRCGSEISSRRRNVSVTVDKFPPAEADMDARNLESAYNLLLNAC